VTPSIKREHFERQITPTACVTACACMALRARGHSPDQRALHVDKSVSGRPFGDITLLVAGARPLAGPDLVQSVSLELATERPVAIEVRGRPWMYLTPVQRARTTSRSLWIDEGDFLHAVVLYGLVPVDGRLMPEDEFLCLDPFFSASDQPLRLTAAQLRSVLTRAIAL